MKRCAVLTAIVLTAGICSCVFAGSPVWNYPPETDPIFSAAITNYYTKVESDARFLIPAFHTFNGAGPVFVFGVGSSALTNNSSTTEALGIGTAAGAENSGDYVTFLGGSAGSYNTGEDVVGIGRTAAWSNTGNQVIGIGEAAGHQNTGNWNTFLGDNAGRDVTQSYINIFGKWSSTLSTNITSPERTYLQGDLYLYDPFPVTAGGGTRIFFSDGTVVPGSNVVLTSQSNTYQANKTNDFSAGAIEGRTPLTNPELTTKAYVDAAVASPPTNTAVYGCIYIHSGTSTNSITPADTYVQLEGWTVGNAVGMTLSTSNITIAADGTYQVTQFQSFSGGANKTLESGIFVNGVEEVAGEFKRKLGTGGDVGSAAGGTIITLNAGDVLDVRMKCINSTADVVIEEGVLMAILMSSVTSGTNWSQHPAQNDVDFSSQGATNFGVLNTYHTTDTLNGTNGAYYAIGTNKYWILFR